MRHLILLTVLWTTLPAKAQVNFPFPDSAATWVQYYEVMTSPPPVPTFTWMTTANFCMDGRDTLLAGQTYSQLFHCGADYVGGIRTDSGAVHFFPADSSQAYLLYDFGVSAGDTLRNVYVNEELGVGTPLWLNPGLLDMVILSVGPNSLYDGRITVQAEAYGLGSGISTEWIEGIGCMHGLFTYNPVNISEYWYGLHCMSHMDTTHWYGGYVDIPAVCAPQYVGLHEPPSPPSVSVRPNPTANVLTISSSIPVERAWISDLSGRTLETLPRNIAQLQLDLSTYADGTYLLHMLVDGTLVIRRVVRSGN